MRHDFLDRYSRLASPIHRLPAALKLALALGLVFTVVLGPLSLGIWVAVPLILAAGLSRVPLRFLLQRLLLVEPFVLGVALLTLFPPNNPLKFLTVVTKSTLCLGTMILLANTTPFADLLVVLRRVRVPALFVTTLALLYRYLFVLVDEAERMRRARASRTFTPDRWSVWRQGGTLIGQLFVRSTERAERVYAAMCARGWR